MSLKEFMDNCSHLSIFQERIIGDDLVDVALFNKDLEGWTEALVGFFGEAVKPAGVEPTDEHQELTKNYSGVCTNQTLFKKDFDKKTVIAMFWPWQGQEYTTLKMGQLTT